MTSQNPDVVVLGAGVVGLTTAVRLAEAGLTVEVQSAEPPEQTTSAVAGAIWGPHLVGRDDRVPRWADATNQTLNWLANDPATGVHLVSGLSASRAQMITPPDWATGADDIVGCPPDQLPDGYASGYRLTAATVAMPTYLRYLQDRLHRAGCPPIRTMRYGSLADAAGQSVAPVLVNCTGVAASQLVPDPSVVPVRGQVVMAENPGITEFFVGTGPEHGDLTYLFPHADIIVLGGTEQPGNWSREPDQATADQIMRACTAVEPRLRDATIVAHKVGLRPSRPLVRLEAEGGSPAIIHNYGHGGAGVTLSWGCASDAAELAIATLGLGL